LDAKKTGPNGPKKPRLTALNRLDIEACLNDGMLPYAIAKRIGCDIQSVIREIHARAKSVNVGAAYRVSNKCVRRRECEKSVYRYANGNLPLAKRHYQCD